MSTASLRGARWSSPRSSSLTKCETAWCTESEFQSWNTLIKINSPFGEFIFLMRKVLNLFFCLTKTILTSVMLDNILKQGFEEVKDLTALRTSGSRNSRLFFIDDVITIGDTVILRRLVDKDGKPVISKKTGVQAVAYYVIGQINGQEAPISLATFRRWPHDLQAFFNEGGLSRQLYDCETDLERYNLLKGNTVKVVKVVDGQTTDFRAAPDSAGKYPSKSAKFPVFDWVK